MQYCEDEEHWTFEDRADPEGQKYPGGHSTHVDDPVMFNEDEPSWHGVHVVD